MSIATNILRVNHTARQVRKAAQAQCCSMHRNHRKNRDQFWFGDRSYIVVVGHSVYLTE